ncbi:VOC family protein [Caenispirillum salinarum]|uniref:VOC family protein n=1 Tax=Caenispirillum salinarum TaxID=859058 RepID=UPI00384FFD11
MHVLKSWVRVFCDTKAAEDVIDFYRGLTGGELQLSYGYKERRVRMAGISSPNLSVMVVAGDSAARKPFESVRLTLEVDDLAAVEKAFTYIGGEVLERAEGALFVRHPDGTLAEYVRHGGGTKAAAAATVSADEDGGAAS